MARGGGGERKQPTLVDVAETAGVSLSTASRVLRKESHNVRSDLVELVLAAAKELGYIPNMMASNLRGNQRDMVGLVVCDMVEPYFAEISEVVTKRADAAGLVAVVANMGRDPRNEINLCAKLWQHRIAGLVLSGGGFDQMTDREELIELVSRMTRSGLPIATLTERDLGVPVFSANDHSVGSLMARQLVRNGHRNIAVVFGPENSITTRRRVRGVRRVLHAEGIDAEVEHVDYTWEQGERFAEQVLLNNPNPPTAILAGSDSLAFGIMRRAIRGGVKVPDDVSIIGVGNTLHAELAHPPITTVDVSTGKAADAAARYIFARVRGEDIDPKSVGRRFTPRLIDRGSISAI